MLNIINAKVPVEDCFPIESRPKWSWSLNSEWLIISYEGDESDMCVSIPTDKLKEALKKLK